MGFFSVLSAIFPSLAAYQGSTNDPKAPPAARLVVQSHSSRSSRRGSAPGKNSPFQATLHNAGPSHSQQFMTVAMTPAQLSDYNLWLQQRGDVLGRQVPQGGASDAAVTFSSVPAATFSSSSGSSLLCHSCSAY